MKILILTDSLGLPRFKPESCFFEETWPIVLKDIFPNIHQVSIGAATSQIILKQINYQKAFNPDIVVLQVGIVDCAPRFMTRKELDLTYAFGFLGKGLRFLFNKNWIRKLRNISYVDEVDFKKNMMGIKNSFSCPVIVIDILPSSEEYERLLPGVTNKINAYNNILKQNFEYLVESKEILAKNGIMTDHHHLNKNGHAYLVSKLEQIIQKIVNSRNS
jgi:hypothetical protein